MARELVIENLRYQAVEVVALNSQVGVVDLPLKEPMRLPFGVVDSRPSGVLKLKLLINGQEVEGYGEGATLSQPVFTDDSGDTIGGAVWQVIDSLRLQGKISLSEVVNRIHCHSFDGDFRYPTARMTVEMALLDAYARYLGQPLRELLGVDKNIREVSFGKSLGGGSSQEIVEQALESIANGSRKIKLKISPTSFDEVVAALDQLKDYPQVDLMVDANGTFDSQLPSHLLMLSQLDTLGLVMIEEPVSRVGEVRGLDAVHLMRKSLKLKTPICLDDCLIDYERTGAAIELGLADIVNIKPGRIGSIIKSIELAKFCKSRGKQVMVGGMLEATPGRCMTVTLAALFRTLGFTIPGDLSLAQERLAADIVTESEYLQYGSEGGIVLPQGPGWGFSQLNI